MQSGATSSRPGALWGAREGWIHSDGWIHKRCLSVSQGPNVTLDPVTPPKKKNTSSLNSFAHPWGIHFSSNAEAIRSPGAWRPEGTWEKRMDSIKWSATACCLKWCLFQWIWCAIITIHHNHTVIIYVVLHIKSYHYVNFASYYIISSYTILYGILLNSIIF